MLPLRYKWFWISLGFVGLVLILGLALLPGGPSLPLAYGDKFLHVLAFAFLTNWFLGMVDEGLTLRVLAGLMVYGLLIEFLQGLVVYRAADPYDVLADLIGIAGGWLLAIAGLRQWCTRIEALLGSQQP